MERESLLGFAWQQSTAFPLGAEGIRTIGDGKKGFLYDYCTTSELLISMAKKGGFQGHWLFRGDFSDDQYYFQRGWV